MKKIYSLALLMGMALSVSAAGLTVNNRSESEALKSMNEKCHEVVVSATITAMPTSNMSKVRAKLPDYDLLNDWKDLGEGTFLDCILSGTYAAGTPSPAKVAVQESQSNPGVYRLVDPFKALVPGAATNYIIIDASDPEFVLIPEQATCLTDNVDGLTYCASMSYVALSEYNYSKAVFIENFANYNLTLKDGVINIPAESVWLQWPNAPADSKYETDPTGWYKSAKYAGYLALPGAEVKPEWEAVGTGKMVDGMFGPMFGANNTSAYDVTVEKSTIAEGVIRVLNPWSYLVEGAEPLVIDISDPECVAIELQATGIETEEDGMTYIMSASENSNSKAEFLASSYADRCITLSNNKITFPAKAFFFYWPDTDASHIYTATKSFAGSLTLPDMSGVNKLEMNESEDVAPVYYNMQGVQVSVNNLVSGLYIKVTGQKATKVLVK